MLKTRVCRIAVLLSIACAFVSARADELQVTGTVFEDANQNKLFDTSEKRLRAVLVSDGSNVSVTDKEGNYRIETNIGRLLFVSVPGSHHAPGNNFYRPVETETASKGIFDFPLAKNADSDDSRKFTFVFVSDTHAAPWRRANEGVAKAYKAIADSNPALVVHGGDIIFDALKASDRAIAEGQYDLYKNQLAPIIKVPFYHAIGNHDVFGWIALPDPVPHPPLYGKRMYEKYFGPTYYSFNYKHCHFVVLDSIGRSTDDAGVPSYYGFIDESQLDWLQKDLAHVEQTTPIIVVTHIPTLNALGSAYGLKSEVLPLPGGERTLKHQVHNFPYLLGEVLKGHNLKLVLAGHYHTYEQIRWKTNEHDALFVVGGSVCGEWWKGDRIMGYSTWPEGYTLIRVHDEKFEISYVPYGWHGIDEQQPVGNAFE